MKPSEQTQVFLAWFAQIGVTSFDLAASRRNNGGVHKTSKAPVELADITAHLAWLRAENVPNDERCGADIYIRPASGEAWPVVLLDDVTLATAQAIQANYEAIAIESSRNNYQIWIHTDRSLPAPGRHAVQKALCARYGSDTGSLAGDKNGRLPGFKNHKPGRGGAWVNFRGASPTGAALFPVDSVLTLAPADAPPLSLRGGSAFNNDEAPAVAELVTCDRNAVDESANEFAYCLAALRRGVPLDYVRSKLTAHAAPRRQRDTGRYVELTLANACNRARVQYAQSSIT